MGNMDYLEEHFPFIYYLLVLIGVVLFFTSMLPGFITGAVWGGLSSGFHMGAGDE